MNSARHELELIRGAVHAEVAKLVGFQDRNFLSISSSVSDPLNSVNKRRATRMPSVLVKATPRALHIRT
jgi:hypothetical protein